MQSFHPVVRAWFQENFGAPSPPQAGGWPVISRGENCLILAPTGSGKTLAAFLKCLDSLYREGDRLQPGVQVLYISPLKALNNDIHRNLELPLEGIEAKAAAMGVPLPHLTRALRTGDTPASERTAMVKHPPHILITTPESLYLILTSKARKILQNVRYVIVDEIHALCGNKRGVHLSLSLERLEALLPAPPVRIGLSATQRPLEEIARFLGGVGRAVHIVDTGTRKELDLLVEVPLDDMRALPENTMWAAIQPRLLELVNQHRSTLIFVNGRGLAERLTDRLNILAGREIARVHHGSISREAREVVETELKQGRLQCLVATSSLELGIDVGAIDLVIQVESPKSVARGLQRVGRAGHVIGGVSRGRLLPKFRGDLLETACIVMEMRRGAVEETHIPIGALDVLAQQIVAMAAMDEWGVPDLLALVRRSHCYRDLTERQLSAVLEMLSGRYPAEEFRELRPRIVWDRQTGTVRGREGAKSLAVLTGGVIPDRGYYGVYIAGTNVKLGEVEEEFVYESRVGDLFLLGTATWRIQTIEHDRITVIDGLGATPRMPFWKGDDIGRPYELGLKVGQFMRELSRRMESPGVEEWLTAECALEPRAVRNLIAYLQEQAESTGVIPSDRLLVAELFWDEVGDRRLVIHSPFGGRVHAALMVVLRRRIRAVLGLEAEMTQADDGLMVRLPGADRAPDVAELLRVSPDEAMEMLMDEVGSTPLFGAYFRMNATRSLVLPRPRPGRRRPFWLQRLKAADLLQVARRYDSFPVILETYREVLKDVLDTEGLRAVLQGLQTGEIGLEVVETDAPSPMAVSTMFKFVGQQMYAGDTPKAERRAALLSVNRDLLREILGTQQLRELLDLRAIAAVEAQLQRTAEGWRARNPDEAEDLLRRLGDLTEAELVARGAAPGWLDHRAAPVELNGERRWISVEDRAMYADLRGDPGPLIRRYVRNHGPFRSAQIAERYGLPLETVERNLAALVAEGAVVSGEFSPDLTEPEFCDAEVLQQIHRRTLSVLRREVEPVEWDAYARFLMDWQGVGARQGSVGARQQVLRRTLGLLQGAVLPAEVWERDLLPGRVEGYQTLWLDQLCATGEIHWLAGPGRKLSFYLPEQVGVLSARFRAPAPGPLEPEPRAILELLAGRGADFLGGLARAAGLPPSRTLEALWELVWAGLVTNDTFAPLRLALRAGRAVGRRGRPVSTRASAGRWSLAARLLPEQGQNEPGPAEAGQVEALTWLLLGRYGVLTREAVQAEEWPLSWPEALAALKRMEWRGRVRQGYFIKELSGAQFALPEAVERLRAARENVSGTFRLLTACDPANPYGALLPMPEGSRIARLPSTFLVLEDGRPMLAAESYGRRLTPLGQIEGERLSEALLCLKGMLKAPATVRSYRRLEVEFWGEQPIHDAAAAPRLEAIGFERMPSKLVLYR